MKGETLRVGERAVTGREELVAFSTTASLVVSSTDTSSPDIWDQTNGEIVSEKKTDTLIDPSYLFRFEITVPKADFQWSTKGLKLPESCRMPSFGALGGRPVFADIRLAWNDLGIAVHVTVNGKRALPWCRDSRLDESDGFHLWLDTRCSPGIHRATQYCHRFLWMPAGGGPRRDRAVSALVPINRALNHPKGVPADQLPIVAYPRHDGYELSGIIPAKAMTGFDPKQQSRLSMYYTLIDRELGWQTFSLGPEYPVMEDPSLWGEAVLSSKKVKMDTVAKATKSQPKV